MAGVNRLRQTEQSHRKASIPPLSSRRKHSLPPLLPPFRSHGEGKHQPQGTLALKVALFRSSLSVLRMNIKAKTGYGIRARPRTYSERVAPREKKVAKGACL